MLYLCIATVCICGCASHGSKTIGTEGFAAPLVVQQQGGGPWVNFSVPGLYNGTITDSIIAGSDGATWFCEGGAIGRIDMSGAVTSYILGSGHSCWGHYDSQPSITKNPDGNIYGISGVDGIVQITASGTTTFFKATQSNWATITSGWDGNLWITGDSGVYRMTTAGVFTFFPTDLTTPCGPIIRGPDKNLWTYGVVGSGSCYSPTVFEMIRYDGSFVDYSLALGPVFMSAIVSGNDGGIWFSTINQMGRLDVATGSVTYYPISKRVLPLAMVMGRHELLYMLGGVDRKSGEPLWTYNIKIHRLYPQAYDSFNPFADMAMGPDGNLWISDEQNNKISVYVVDTLTTVPTTISVGVGVGAGLAASEKQYLRPLNAITSDPSIATVAAGNTADTWTVTGVASGMCFVTIYDAKGNSIAVPVTVN